MGRERQIESEMKDSKNDSLPEKNLWSYVRMNGIQELKC